MDSSHFLGAKVRKKMNGGGGIKCIFWWKKHFSTLFC